MPYIDVMLVLLIIFMVTAPLLNLGVDIQLPQSKAKSVQNDKEPAVVSVDKDGKLYLTLGTRRARPIEPTRAGREGVGVRARRTRRCRCWSPATSASTTAASTRRWCCCSRPASPKVGLMSQPEQAQDAH